MEFNSKDNRGNYGFHVEIIRRWVKDHKSLYDELESREPYGAKIYEIAKQLKEKHPDIAQALLEPLGRLNPYHTKANQLLAEMLIKKKQLEKANGVLNKLYSYNANAAKEHLIKVLLELARSLGSNKESKEPSSWFEQVVYWWKSTFSPDIGEEEQRLNLYKQVLEIERNNIEAAREKRKIEEQRKAREWKQQVIKWKQSVKMSFKSKLTWRFLGIVLIFIVSYLFFSQRLFPPGIVLEVEQLPDESTYLLENVPSAIPYHLQSITIDLDETVNFEKSPKFKYKNYTKEIDLIKGSSTLQYGIDKDRLQQELQEFEVTSFEYEEENSLQFIFKARNLKFKEECKASNTNGKDIPCQVKEKGYLSIFRGIPWWAIAIALIIIWIIVVEVVFALKTKREYDDVVY
ncbi:MAG: tetratricopeptide repeat protein [Thioploca sp.]|nr:tetratricopeptide repeat protein [Thioploca sp.]